VNFVWAFLLVEQSKNLQVFAFMSNTLLALCYLC